MWSCFPDQLSKVTPKILPRVVKTNKMPLNTSSYYVEKHILAPMVRMNTLPFRLLALGLGADLVYSEEIVDKRILECKRVVNECLGTIDYVDERDGCVVFRTCERERGKIVFQMGTSDPERALQAAKKVAGDVFAVDVNMGCPKEFSLKGNMGAALLTQPSLIQSILSKLVEGLTIPVSCKIRLLPDLDDTVKLASLIQNCGVVALAVHGRTKDERPRHPNNKQAIKRITEALNIPVIANGGSADIACHDDFARYASECGTSNVMIARAAQWNCSVFRKTGLLPLDDVMQSYLKLAIQYDNTVNNTKYCLQAMFKDTVESEKGQLLLHSKTMRQICAIWNMEDLYEEHQKRFALSKLVPDGDEIPFKKIKTDDIVRVPVRYDKHLYPNVDQLPKSFLMRWTQKQSINMPKYHTEAKDKVFYSTVTIQGKTYASVYPEKNKRQAEQAAALACIHALGLQS